MKIEWLAASALLFVAGTASAATKQWDFAVFIDKRQVGTHRFTLIEQGGTRRIETVAKFDVRILGVKAFHYDHRDSETWKNGCLESLHSTTDSDGKPFKVDGQKSGARFELKTLDASRSLDGCISTFAYWDKAVLKQTQLLNSQTGEYARVAIAAAGNGKAKSAGMDVEVERHRITGPQLDITLSYSRDGDWMGLESIVDGKTLRYVRK